MSLAHPVFFLPGPWVGRDVFSKCPDSALFLYQDESQLFTPSPMRSLAFAKLSGAAIFSLLQLPGQHRSSRSSGSYLVFNPIDFPPLPVSFRAGVPQGFLQQIIIGEVHFRKAGKHSGQFRPKFMIRKPGTGFADQFPDKISAWLGPRL